MEYLEDCWFRTLQRFHNHRLRFRNHGDLAMMEFLMLLGVSVLLENTGGLLTLSDIIEVTGMTMSAASRKISILEKKGFLSKRASESDKRKYYITLTEQGKALCEKERLAKRAWVQQIIARMGEEDTKQMLNLVNKMFDIIEDLET